MVGILLLSESSIYHPELRSLPPFPHWLSNQGEGFSLTHYLLLLFVYFSNKASMRIYFYILYPAYFKALQVPHICGSLGKLGC